MPVIHVQFYCNEGRTRHRYILLNSTYLPIRKIVENHLRIVDADIKAAATTADNVTTTHRPTPSYRHLSVRQPRVA